MILRRKRTSLPFRRTESPKSENLRRIAREPNLGLNSIVFMGNTPEEIEIVKQFVPEIETIWLGPDPAEYASQLLNCRTLRASINHRRRPEARRAVPAAGCANSGDECRN